MRILEHLNSPPLVAKNVFLSTILPTHQISMEYRDVTYRNKRTFPSPRYRPRRRLCLQYIYMSYSVIKVRIGQKYEIKLAQMYLGCRCRAWFIHRRRRRSAFRLRCSSRVRCTPCLPISLAFRLKSDETQKVSVHT